MSNSSKCLVLDNSYTARSIITTERAFVIFYKGNAHIVANHNETFGLVNKDLDIYKPSIIRVDTYVDVHNKVSLNRENIYKRDNFECVYCGNSDRRLLTLDHVIPQSKGGPNTWDNLVTACKPCNGEKADMTVEEYGHAHPNPKRPHYLMLMKKVDYDIPEEWKDFLYF